MMKVKKFIWIPIAAVVVIAVAVLVLSLVRVNPVLAEFQGFDRIELIESSNEYHVGHKTEVVDGERVDITEQQLEKALRSCDFSLMHAMLEGTFSYGIDVKKVPETKDDWVLGASDIKSYAPLEGEYVLKLCYNKERMIKVGGREINYDNVLIRLYETNGEVKQMDCVPYLEYNVYNNNLGEGGDVESDGKVGSIYYKTPILRVKMNTSQAMIDIGELFAD